MHEKLSAVCESVCVVMCNRFLHLYLTIFSIVLNKEKKQSLKVNNKDISYAIRKNKADHLGEIFS